MELTKFQEDMLEWADELVEARAISDARCTSWPVYTIVDRDEWILRHFCLSEGAAEKLQEVREYDEKNNCMYVQSAFRQVDQAEEMDSHLGKLLKLVQKEIKRRQENV